MSKEWNLKLVGVVDVLIMIAENALKRQENHATGLEKIYVALVLPLQVK
jgi:hypothetical protein